jgi:hypothetical protein
MKFLKKYWYWLLVPVILGTMFATMYFSSKGDSAIVDEIAHIPSGYSYITMGDYRLNPEHPPLFKDLSGLAILLSQKVVYPYAYVKADNPVVNNEWEAGWHFLYETPGNNPDNMLIAARIPEMLISLTLGLLVFLWARKLFGNKAGVLALILYAFDANIIAHSRFVTSDLIISFAFFLNFFTLYYLLKKPNWTKVVLTGVTVFIVLVAKFSAAILAPAYLIVFAMLILRKGTETKTNLLSGIFDKDWKKRLLSSFSIFAIISIIGVVLMWGFYFFHTMNMPGDVQRALIHESLPEDSAKNIVSVLDKLSYNPVTKPLGQYLLGLTMVSSHVEGGHDAYFLGMTSNKGWWFYYPVVIALKTAIPIFIFAILLFVFWRYIKKYDWFTELYLWVVPLCFLVMGMQGSLDLGIRYMLPLFPFLYVVLARLADVIDFKNLFAKKRDWYLAGGTLIMIVLLIWYVAESLLTYPHYLSYFNEFAGGYQNGYKYLTDSNLDWGQDVKRLSNWVKDDQVSKDHNCQYQIYVDVFPGSMPAKYYLGNRMIEWHVQNGRPTGCFAVSATFYQNSKIKKGVNGGMDYSWLDSLKPIANINGSILIYDLKQQ